MLNFGGVLFLSYLCFTNVIVSVANKVGTVPGELNENLMVDELAVFLEKKENIPVMFCQKLKVLVGVYELQKCIARCNHSPACY